MRVFITGIAGFIGSHIAEAMIREGHKVYGIDDLSTGRKANVPKGIRFVQGDVRDQSLFDLHDEIDLIYHCAASYKDRNDWERDASTNVLGTINVVRQAQVTKAKLIYFQTSLCYGPNPHSPVKIGSPLAPKGSYAVSKTAGERYIADSGIDYVSLRLANMYGPRNLSGPVPTFYKRLTEGNKCTVVDTRRDFVYIDDLVEIAVAAATRGHGHYHVSSGSDVEISDLYDAVAISLGITEPATITPRGEDDVERLLLDPSRTFEAFGWKTSTPLNVGISRAVDWYREHGVAQTYTHLAMKG